MFEIKMNHQKPRRVGAEERVYWQRHRFVSKINLQSGDSIRDRWEMSVRQQRKSGVSFERQLTPVKTGPGCRDLAGQCISLGEVNQTNTTSTFTKKYPLKFPRRRAKDSLTPISQSQPGTSQRHLSSGNYCAKHTNVRLS